MGEINVVIGLNNEDVVSVAAIIAADTGSRLELWPEAGLHPAKHAEVAESLLAGARIQGIVVTTHSDVLILRLRRAIVEERLQFSEVKIHYVEQDNSVETITLNECGALNWWPKGIFSEANKEFFEIRRILTGRGLI